MDPLEQALLQAGGFGVVAAIAVSVARALFKKLEDAYDRERQRADRLETQLQELHETIRSTYATTLQEASRAIADALAMVRRER